MKDTRASTNGEGGTYTWRTRTAPVRQAVCWIAMVWSGITPEAR